MSFSSVIPGTFGHETYALSRNQSICSFHSRHSKRIVVKSSIANFDAQSVESEEPIINRFNKSFHSFRYVVAIMAGLSVGLMMLLRLNITVAIINMVNSTQIYLEEHENPDSVDLEEYFGKGYVEVGEFDWNNERQQLIISYYMITYTLPQLFTTKLAIKYGTRIAMPVSLLVCALSTILIPVCAYWGWQWVLVLRLVQGIGASAILPLLLRLIEFWMPFNEITLGLSCAQLLQATLTAANPLIAGYLSSFHWSYAFYVPGAVTLVFCLLWLILVTDRPDENWLVSEKELELICDCTDEDNCSKHSDKDSTGKKSALHSEDIKKSEEEEHVSWVEAFRIPSFYAYIFMWMFYCSSNSSFVFTLPTYLRQFLRIDVELNGIYCFIIQIGGLIAVVWPHPFLQFLQSRFKMSITGARRTTNAMACLIVTATWIYVGSFHDCQLLMFFINRCFQQHADIVVTGSLMSNFSKAGISTVVFSLVNTFGNLSVFFASTFIGYVLDYTGQSIEAWGWIYTVLGLSQLVMSLAFCTIIRSDPIDFKKNESKETNNDEKILGDLEGVIISGKGNGINQFNKVLTGKLESLNNKIEEKL